MKYVKTMEDFFLAEELEFDMTDMIIAEDGIVEEGLSGWLQGLGWCKKNWKIAFGYFKEMNNKAGMIGTARMGLEEEKTGWKDTPKNTNFELFREQLIKIKKMTTGSFAVSPGRGEDSSGAVKQAEKAADEFKKDPTVWDKEIEEYSKMEMPKSMPKK